jgi:hypothetical protein
MAAPQWRVNAADPAHPGVDTPHVSCSKIRKDSLYPAITSANRLMHDLATSMAAGAKLNHTYMR